MALARFMTILILFVSLAKCNDGGHISILVSKTGLEFVKDFLLDKVISTTIPLKLPDIEKDDKIPLIGKVQMGLSNIQINSVDIQSSWIETGKDGIVLSVSGATADLSMDWSYSYKASFFKISDHGNSSVKVKGMDVNVTVNLANDNGSLKIASLDRDCIVESIDIHINGGASWLYQGLVNAFQKTIISTVENTISNKISENMNKLDSLLQSLPKERQIDESAAVNLSFTSNPVLGDSWVKVEMSGLFMPNDKVIVSETPPSSLFNRVNRMVTVSIQEEVFNSATLVYFNANQMHVVIEETKNGSILRTSDWKQIIPELYKQYPDVKMMLNMSVTSAPIVKITENEIDATVELEISIGVQDSGKVLSIAQIASVLNAACSAEIAKNNLTGSLRLSGFNATTKWSKLGDFQAKYVQAATSTVLEALFLPYVNKRLQRGFPLPIPRGFGIKNLEIAYVQSCVLICSDIDQHVYIS